MVRIRRNVADLEAGDVTLEWYGRAIDELRRRPLTDPTGWRYMACVHGAPAWPEEDPYHVAGELRPSQAERLRFWDQCQHQTWYFLPWHRAYLAAFESVVARTVRDLGGPGDWALPYWNYSAGPGSRLMPAAFCAPSLDGAPNPLWIEWGRTDDGDIGFADADVTLDCLDSAFFAGTSSGGEVGFAGPVSAFMHFGTLVGLPNGRIEEGPHNAVHSQIGGLMGDPRYAALDPIFWLHHANIDRLWEVWRRMHPNLSEPTEEGWRKGMAFDLHVADGSVWRFEPGMLLDTRTVLEGYGYDDVQPDSSVSLGIADVAEIAPAGASLIGASDTPVDLVSGLGGGSVHIDADATSLSVLTPRLYLNLENIVGRGEDANFEVYAASAAAGGERLMVGQVSLFGLESASDPEAPHGGHGLNKVIDISRFADRLRLTGAAPSDLEITFERRKRRTSQPEFLDRGAEARVTIGRLSVYAEPGSSE